MSKTEITLQDIFWTLKRYFIWICLTTFVFTAGAWAYTKYFITPMYSTTVSMCVFSSQRKDSTEITNNELIADARIAYTYELLLASQPVLDAVSENLGGAPSAQALRGMISSKAQANTQVIYVTVTNSNPELAARIANTLADVAPKTLSALARGGEMIAIGTADVPTSPISPNMVSNVTVGLALGLLLSCAVIVLIALLDTTIWREEDLERAFHIPVLGSVPSMSTAIQAKHQKGR